MLSVREFVRRNGWRGAVELEKGGYHYIDRVKYQLATGPGTFHEMCAYAQTLAGPADFVYAYQGFWFTHENHAVLFALRWRNG